MPERQPVVIMKKRITGFDLARAYAILGMFIVNFNTVFGSATDNSALGKFLYLFNGNSSSVFVMLAGMGIALMTGRPEYTLAEKARLRFTIVKRSLFLFTAGILLCLWWPADILHFYGGYMLIAACIVFLPKRIYLLAAILAIVIFHLLLLILPFENGWNFEILVYTDFWTLKGFLRNMFYNGWNPVFPWVAYFLAGMWLGRLNWQEKAVRRKAFLTGLFVYLAVFAVQSLASGLAVNDDVRFYLSADYLPPFLPFMLSTSSFGLMIIAGFMYIGSIAGETRLARVAAATGQMTLTHYISHIIIGMLICAGITGRSYTGHLNDREPLTPVFILLFSLLYFMISALFSWLWAKRFRNGPVETLMRKF